MRVAIEILDEIGAPSGWLFTKIDEDDGLPIWKLGHEKAQVFTSEDAARRFASEKMPNAPIRIVPTR